MRKISSVDLDRRIIQRTCSCATSTSARYTQVDGKGRATDDHRLGREERGVGTIGVHRFSSWEHGVPKTALQRGVSLKCNSAIAEDSQWLFTLPSPFQVSAPVGESAHWLTSLNLVGQSWQTFLFNAAVLPTFR